MKYLKIYKKIHATTTTTIQFLLIKKKLKSFYSNDRYAQTQTSKSISN